MITRFLLALTVAFFVTSSQARGSELDRVFDLYYADRYEEAFPPMLSLAQSGVAEAQGAISRMFLNGWGTSKDERAAFYWASRGAESNESESEAVLGWIHWAGAAGFKQDYAKSLYWYERAVSRGGNLGALGSLALLHLELSNPDQAEALTERLVSKKDFSTVFFLASSLEQLASQTSGEEADEYLNKSLKWAQVGASNDDPESIRFLGDIFFWGTHRQKVDELKAVDLYLKSSSLGDAVSFQRLAQAYLYGEQISADIDKGESYLLEGEKRGELYAKFMLAKGYLYGYLEIPKKSDEGYARLRELQKSSRPYLSKLLEADLYLLGEDRPANQQKGLLLILQSILEEEKYSKETTRLYGFEAASSFLDVYESLFSFDKPNAGKFPNELVLAWNRLYFGDVNKDSYSKVAKKYSALEVKQANALGLLEVVRKTISILEQRRNKIGPIEPVDLIEEGWAQFIGSRGRVNEPLAQILVEEGLRLAIRDEDKELIKYARNVLGVILNGAINSGVRNVRLARIHTYDGQLADNLLWGQYLGEQSLSPEEFDRARAQYFEEEGRAHRTLELPPIPQEAKKNPLKKIEFLKSLYSDGDKILADWIALLHEDAIGTQESFGEASFWYRRGSESVNDRAMRADLIFEGKFESGMPNFVGTIYQLFEVDLVRTRGGLLTSLSRAIAPSQDGSEQVQISPNLKLSALVIGNATYQGAELRNSTNDARAISEVFEKFGFEVTTKYNLTRRDFKKTLLDFSETAKDSDVTLFFYAGHGVQLGGVNYFLPTDIDLNASESVITYDGFSLNELKRVGLPGKTKLIFLDACRNNPFKPVVRGTGGRGLAPVNVSRGTLISFATRDGSVSFDGMGGDHSPYTQALLKHLNDPKDVEIMLRSVGDEVMRLTKNRQEPWKYGALTTGQLILPSLRN